MRGWIALVVMSAALLISAPTAAAPPDTAPPDGSSTTTVLDPTGETVVTTVPDTEPQILDPDAGAPTPAPAFTPSAPLIPVPSGCPSADAATVIFVGRIVAMDRNTARYEVAQVRAGSAEGWMVNRLIDVRYDNETQYLEVGERYLVGAKPGEGGRLFSKVAATDLLFGGDAVIGLSDDDQECPVLDDQIRTLRPDGTEVETSLFAGLGGAKGRVAMAFLRPLAVVFAVILALALVRWLFTAIFVAVRRAADVEPVTAVGRARRHLPDL